MACIPKEWLQPLDRKLKFDSDFSSPSILGAGPSLRWFFELLRTDAKAADFLLSSIGLKMDQATKASFWIKDNQPSMKDKKFLVHPGTTSKTALSLFLAWKLTKKVTGSAQTFPLAVGLVAGFYLCLRTPRTLNKTLGEISPVSPFRILLILDLEVSAFFANEATVISCLSNINLILYFTSWRTFRFRLPGSLKKSMKEARTSSIKVVPRSSKSSAAPEWKLRPWTPPFFIGAQPRYIHDEHHQHAHSVEVPSGAHHSHWHRHEPMKHSHPHSLDIHHQHTHENNQSG